MTTVNTFTVPVEFAFVPTEQRSLFEHLDPNPIELSPICEPELPLWKLSAHATSPRVTGIQLFVLILFLAVAVIETGSCLAQLSPLVESDAVSRVVKTAVGGGA